jgi:hypothetical protein
LDRKTAVEAPDPRHGMFEGGFLLRGSVLDNMLDFTRDALAEQNDR